MYESIYNINKTIRFSDWTTVERGVAKPHDLETTPIRIKTDSIIGSEEKINLEFYSADVQPCGTFDLKFSNPLQYHIGWCMSGIYQNLPETLPSDINKVWQLTKFPGFRITLECNGVKVLDTILSSSICGHSVWSEVWSRDIEQIKFGSADTASDAYTWGMLPAGKK